MQFKTRGHDFLGIFLKNFWTLVITEANWRAA